MGVGALQAGITLKVGRGNGTLSLDKEKEGSMEYSHQFAKGEGVDWYRRAQNELQAFVH